MKKRTFILMVVMEIVVALLGGLLIAEPEAVMRFLHIK